MKQVSTDISINRNNEISAYKGELTRNGVKLNCAKVLTAFPQLEDSFTDLLTESLFRNNFTDERFADAVNYVIDNCKYPKPRVSDFVQYDKKVKLYTHSEIIDLKHSDFETYKAVEIDGRDKKLWAHIDDIKEFNLGRK